MDDLIFRIKKAYESIELLKTLGLPVSPEQKQNLTCLEKEYIQSHIIPDVSEIVQGNLLDGLHSFSLKVSYTPDDGVTVTTSKETTSVPASTIERDTARFSIEGGPHLKKRKFVYAVVKKYINDHPNVTFFELENVFPSRLNANTKNGVVRRWSDIRQRITGHPDVATRFFCEPFLVERQNL